MEYLHENGYECLTKENFWDDIKEKYPEELAHFSKWIDKYKKKVGWDYLFKNHHDLPSRSIKYHDMPIAMQGGIFLQYAFEITNIKDPKIIIAVEPDISMTIRNLFIAIDKYNFHKSLRV